MSSMCPVKPFVGLRVILSTSNIKGMISYSVGKKGHAMNILICAMVVLFQQNESSKGKLKNYPSHLLVCGSGISYCYLHFLCITTLCKRQISLVPLCLMSFS